MCFACIWKYVVRPERRQEFLAAYDQDGDWARLFRPDHQYIRTELLEDVKHANRFMTIDYWRSKKARDDFRQRHSSEYDDLDTRCESYTVSEEFVGDFVLGSPPTR